MSLLLVTFLASATLGQYSLGGLAADAPSVDVHLESDSPNVELFRITSHGVGIVATSQGSATVHSVQYRRECRTPCDARLLEPRDDFFIGGDGVSTSDKFSLMGYGDSVSLRVRAGSAGLRGLGFASTYLGTLGALVGGTFLVVSGALAPSGSSLASQSSSGSTFGAIGLYSLLGGGALLAAGIPLIVFNGTKVELGPSTGGLGTKAVRGEQQL